MSTAAPAPSISCSPPLSDAAAIARFFREHGYYIARGLADAATVATLERDFDRVVAQLESSQHEINARWGSDATTALDGDRDSVVIHTHQIQKFSAAWTRWLLDDRLLDVTEALLGPDIVLHHTKLFLKPAGRGAAFPAHQDYLYFPTIEHEMLAATVFLTPADDGNGCLRLWPGSHKLGPLPASNGYDGGFADRFPFCESIAAVVEPGDVVFFHYLTVHGSLPNRGTQPRKSVLVQLQSGRDRLAQSGGHFSSDTVLRGWNHHMTRDRAAT